MNKLLLILLLFLSILIGCSSPREIKITVDKNPELISRVPLPPFNGKEKSNQFILETKLLISKNGNIEDVDLLNSSGDRIRDATATAQIKKWKYSPAIIDGDSIEIRIQQPIKITVTDNYNMHLSEIVCNSLIETDTIYLKIKNGVEFETLAHQYSKSGSANTSGDLGIVDIRNYPYDVQEALAELIVNDISKPVKIGENYHIFKRLPQDGQK